MYYLSFTEYVKYVLAVELDQNISQLNFDKFALEFEESAISTCSQLETIDMEESEQSNSNKKKEKLLNSELSNKCCCTII